VADTTREFELRQQLNLLQDEYQGVLDELIDGVLLSDQHGRILSSNRAARQLLGKEAEDLHGHCWQEFGIHIQRDSVEPQIAWCAGPAGKPFLAEFRLSLRKESGRLGSTLIIRDLTLIRKDRAELVELRERERAAVGQELHDDLGQMLTALSYVAEVLAGRLDKSPQLAEMARQISTLAKQSIAKTRAIARGLYPVVLERSGLVGALQDLASTTEEFFGVSCRVRAGQSRLDSRLSLHLFRIAQEAVTNAVKHANCRSIDIFLRSGGSRVWLEVADDGQGIYPASRLGLGLGMRSMRQHIELIEGDLEVESHPDSGTRIRCWAPHVEGEAPGAG